MVDTRADSLSVDEIAMLLITEIRRLKATRVVIDSLSGFELSLAPTFRDDYRESMARLVSALANTGATVLMTSGLEDRYSDLRFSPSAIERLSAAYASPRATQATAVTVNGSEGTRRRQSSRRVVRWSAPRLAR